MKVWELRDLLVEVDDEDDVMVSSAGGPPTKVERAEVKTAEAPAIGKTLLLTT